MKQFTFPITKAQKDFEDYAKTLLKAMADLSPEKQVELVEYAMELAYEEKHE